MPTSLSPSPLLARITAALAAASAAGVLITACGGDTTNGADGPVTCQRALPQDGANTTERSACRADTDCAANGYSKQCFAPGTSSCGNIGGERIPACANDAACASQGGDLVCEPKNDGHAWCEQKCTDDAGCDAAFTCELATGHCVPRACDSAACPAETFCSAAKVCVYQRCNDKRPCGDGFTCSATFVCEATPCPNGTDAECTATHACNAGSKTCQRKTCTCDTECGSGYCVEGSCYAAAGTCQGACAAGRPLIDQAGEAVIARIVRGDTGGW